MNTILRSALVALALIGTVSAASAAPRDYQYSGASNSFDSGVIADFNRAANIEN